MKMNRAQIVALVAGITLMIGMGLYPPWRVELNIKPKWRSCAYGCLFAPPRMATCMGSHASPYVHKLVLKSRPCRAIGLDVSRLLVQWVVVTALTAGAIVALGATMRLPNWKMRLPNWSWKQTRIFCVLIFSAAIVWASYKIVWCSSDWGSNDPIVVPAPKATAPAWDWRKP